MNASKIIGTILVTGMLSGCSMMGDKYAVYFDTGSTKITKNDKLEISKVAKLAKKDDKKVKIVGYADNTGSKEINKKISEKRVDTVNKELVKWGIDPMNVSTVARGEGWLDKKDQDNRDKRRVEIRIY